jgi:chemotaxis protein methyltransferase CheR
MSVIGADDYVDFCDGLRQICGIDLSQYKRPQMERRLRSFVARKGISRLTDWRHPEQWIRLERDVLPELAGTGGSVRAWSAGCSYGAEAFTLASVCMTSIPSVPVTILGTDIDKRMIERARAGVFTADDARGLAIEQVQRGFEQIPDGWRARDALKRMTTFELGDLLRVRPRPASQDLILCRNTVIYFAEPIRDELHGRLATALRPGGYLIVGATERVAKPGDLHLEMAHPFIYRKA